MGLLKRFFTEYFQKCIPCKYCQFLYQPVSISSLCVLQNWLIQNFFSLMSHRNFLPQVNTGRPPLTIITVNKMKMSWRRAYFVTATERKGGKKFMLQYVKKGRKQGWGLIQMDFPFLLSPQPPFDTSSKNSLSSTQPNFGWQSRCRNPLWRSTLEIGTFDIVPCSKCGANPFWGWNLSDRQTHLFVIIAPCQAHIQLPFLSFLRASSHPPQKYVKQINVKVHPSCLVKLDFWCNLSGHGEIRNPCHSSFLLVCHLNLTYKDMHGVNETRLKKWTSLHWGKSGHEMRNNLCVTFSWWGMRIQSAIRNAFSWRNNQLIGKCTC